MDALLEHPLDADLKEAVAASDRLVEALRLASASQDHVARLKAVNLAWETHGAPLQSRFQEGVRLGITTPEWRALSLVFTHMLSVFGQASKDSIKANHRRRRDLRQHAC